jgi:hypothetical protein
MPNVHASICHWASGSVASFNVTLLLQLGGGLLERTEEHRNDLLNFFERLARDVKIAKLAFITSTEPVWFTESCQIVFSIWCMSLRMRFNLATVRYCMTKRFDIREVLV